MSSIAASSRIERGWRWFAIVAMGFAAFGGAVGAVTTIAQYHALTTRGVHTTGIAGSAWRVKGGWDCSVSFTDTSGVRRVETVSDCGNVRRGQTISITYDRSDPATVDPTASVTALDQLGQATVLALLSVLLSFCTWALWRKPTWAARRGAVAGQRPGPLTRI